jgi:hypothetical protein
VPENSDCTRPGTQIFLPLAGQKHHLLAFFRRERCAAAVDGARRTRWPTLDAGPRFRLPDELAKLVEQLAGRRVAALQLLDPSETLQDSACLLHAADASDARVTCLWRQRD